MTGRNFGAKAAARKLGLGRDAYKLAGETIKFGPNKGKPLQFSILRIELSNRENLEKHLAEMEQRLDRLIPFIAAERSKAKNDVNIMLTIGTTVGGGSISLAQYRLALEQWRN